MSSFRVDKGISKFFKAAYEKQKLEEFKDSFFPPDPSVVYFHNSSPQSEKTPEQYFVNYSKYFANICFSTYPVMNNQKFGKPIADFTQTDVYKNMAIMSIADGCGMGSRPAKSAHVACEKFAEYVSSEAVKEKTLGRVLRVMSDAMAYVQCSILETEETSMDAGLTTFQAVVVLRTDQMTYAVLYISLGDCRGLLVHRSSEKIEELVEGYVSRVDVKTTGGRLGPVEGDLPELDNYRCGIRFVHPGTSVLLMTDGICDNFDIRMFVDKPSECGLSGNEWLDEDVQHQERRKSEFFSKMVEMYLEPSLVQLCENVYDFVVERTQKQRTLKIEASKTKTKIPASQSLHGKMDHSTLTVLVLNDGLFNRCQVEPLELEVPVDMKI
uniref:PPM-type phosphatase domain-containing protein n=1 Tax=Entamoeba invadens TaxID=33085 RepID=S0B148_ENTIV|nr:hypothetical protein [Entamoeba invadens]